MGKKIKTRTCFSFVGSDYSAQEPRSLASFAHDIDMLQAYAEGKDLYALIGSFCFHNNYEDNLEFHPVTHKLQPDGKKRRSKAKTILLAVLYGMSAATMAARIGSTKEEAEEIIKNFYAGFKGVALFTQQSQAMLKKYGYVTDLWGRRRHIPDAQLPEFEVTPPENLQRDFNPLLGLVPRPNPLAESNKQKYLQQLKVARGKVARDKIIADAKKNGYTIKNNGGFINRALRQCLNARIQGCIDGEARVQTKKYGLKKLKDIVGETLELWDGDAWTTGEITYSGKKQKCTITFNNKQTIMCSPIHKFLVVNTAGGTKWVECKDLKSGDRVCINENYVPSEYHYTSDRSLDDTAWNSKNLHCDDISNSFELGRVLGRLASDGSYGVREDGGSCLYQLIAEHEFDILPILEGYMKPWNCTTQIKPLRENRTQQMANIRVTSLALNRELEMLDIKHCIHENIFADTECLRGFISGFFDGDGGISGNNITLTFGEQYDFLPLIKDLQKALTFFGIRSSYVHYSGYGYRLKIRRADSQRFAQLIGFISKDKQQLAESMTTVKDNHCFKGRHPLIVNEVEITEEFVDMYDVCNTDRGYYVIDGLITHNTAASMTKLAMIRVHNDPIMKSLGFKLVCSVHDEMFGEVPRENAEAAAERLAELMIGAAKDKCDCKFKVDPYVISRWYEDELYGQINQDYNKLINGDPDKNKPGLTPEAAYEKMRNKYVYLQEKYLHQMCDGTYECNTHNDI